jgi:hypothetical protein
MANSRLFRLVKGRRCTNNRKNGHRKYFVWCIHKTTQLLYLFYTADVYFEEHSVVMATCFCELFRLLTAVRIFLGAIMSLYLSYLWPMQSSEVSTNWGAMLWLMHTLLSLLSSSPLSYSPFCFTAALTLSVMCWKSSSHASLCSHYLTSFRCFRNSSQHTKCQEFRTCWFLR